MPYPVKRLRNRLVLLFLTATLVPTSAVLWMSIALIQHSLGYVGTDQLDTLSKSLQAIARDYYRLSCESLKKEAAAGNLEARRFSAAALSGGPASLVQFRDSKEAERFELSRPDGGRLDYLVRKGSEILVYSRDLNGARMDALTRQYRQARKQVEEIRQRDLQRGFTYTLVLLSALIWAAALVCVLYLANRISRPIQELTAGLHRLAAGDFSSLADSGQRDEIGLAVQAFNDTAVRLQHNRDRLVYLTRIASWQALARKMAHELKNSLTPIRLTVEEILARSSSQERQFLEGAVQVAVGEVEILERRVRAFSEFASEPAVNTCRLDLNALIQERVRFIEVAYPEVHYRIEMANGLSPARGDPDQVKGILTNLLKNAAEAAGAGGTVWAITKEDRDRVLFEVHDSGPGLSNEARRSLFEPSISFKAQGMGLGLSISRKNALSSGGDLELIDGSLGGAAFRLTLPAENENDGS